MSIQNYKNHVRYYPAHHFVFYPLLLAGIFYAVRCAGRYPDQEREWIAMAGLLFLVGWLSFMLRQHYALGNQNRIVRMELRFRYYVLTGKRLEPVERQLSFGQLAALRFASDEELPALVERALKEGLSANAIKQAVQHWVADEMRV